MEGGASGGAAPYAGCEHYKRSVQLECSACKEFFPCRFCHDHVKLDVRGLEGAHALERKAVTRVKCMACGAVQAPAKACSACSTVLGNYFCGVCNLYDHDTSKRQFHCEGCGLCRTGGAENFRHCEGCKTCVPRSQGQHKCLEGAMDSDCPVCQENMFASRKPSQPLNCGHYMHSECMLEFISTASGSELTGRIKRCPFCQASAIDHKSLWRELDMEVRGGRENAWGWPPSPIARPASNARHNTRPPPTHARARHAGPRHAHAAGAAPRHSHPVQ